jgi:environmental stress-induced protein Ves
VSVAHVDASGPFSDFTAYNRKMVLLRGAGLALKFADGERRTLRHIGELIEFDGAVSAYCELLNGPCVDLNLIVSKSVPSYVRVERVAEECMLRASADESTVVFSIEDPLLVESDSGESLRLEPWDLGVVSRCGGRIRKIQPGKSAAPSIVFFATIGN